MREAEYSFLSWKIAWILWRSNQPILHGLDVAHNFVHQMYITLYTSLASWCKLKLFLSFQEIERFINEAEHGVIYVNLGSTVKDSTLPPEKLSELLSTFNKLPLRVLWKWDGGSIENLPRNVMTMRWFPQYDVLSESFISLRFIYGRRKAYENKPRNIWQIRHLTANE